MHLRESTINKQITNNPHICIAFRATSRYNAGRILHSWKMSTEIFATVQNSACRNQMNYSCPQTSGLIEVWIAQEKEGPNITWHAFTRIEKLNWYYSGTGGVFIKKMQTVYGCMLWVCIQLMQCAESCSFRRAWFMGCDVVWFDILLIAMLGSVHKMCKLAGTVYDVFMIVCRGPGCRLHTCLQSTDPFFQCREKWNSRMNI